MQFLMIHNSLISNGNSEELAENQTVQGVIIALDEDQRIRRALSFVPTVEFYRYQISFKLVKV